MPPPLLFSLDGVDLDHVEITREQIYQKLPHRHEFMQLDGVILFDAVARRAVGFRDVREDEWWVRGHVPGNAVFPGVLMIEAAAHLACLFNRLILNDDRFLAFGGLEEVKFRDAVVPPARVIFLGQALEIKPRRTICSIQALVDNRMVFEGRIIGLPMSLADG